MCRFQKEQSDTEHLCETVNNCKMRHFSSLSLFQVECEKIDVMIKKGGEIYENQKLDYA